MKITKAYSEVKKRLLLVVIMSILIFLLFQLKNYPAFVEHYYYPLSIENINSKLKDSPPIKIGKYLIINSNIIFTEGFLLL